MVLNWHALFFGWWLWMHDGLDTFRWVWNVKHYKVTHLFQQYKIGELVIQFYHNCMWGCRLNLEDTGWWGESKGAEKSHSFRSYAIDLTYSLPNQFLSLSQGTWSLLNVWFHASVTADVYHFPSFYRNSKGTRIKTKVLERARVKDAIHTMLTSSIIFNSCVTCEHSY